jgi:hypothetical protein
MLELERAREALRLARRAGATVELDAGVSVVALALVVNRVPVPAARAECDELLRLVAGRRFAELGVRGFAAVLDAMAGKFAVARAQLVRSREGLNDLGLSSGLDLDGRLRRPGQAAGRRCRGR